MFALLCEESYTEKKDYNSYLRLFFRRIRRIVFYTLKMPLIVDMIHNLIDITIEAKIIIIIYTLLDEWIKHIIQFSILF